MVPQAASFIYKERTKRDRQLFRQQIRHASVCFTINVGQVVGTRR